jgi:hypothetical protein
MERRESLLDEFERSGLSGAKFAALMGLKYQTFASWLQKRRQQRGASATDPVKPADPVRWLEAVLEQSQGGAAGAGASLLVQLPGGARVEITNVHQLALAAALVQALEKPC